MLTGKDVILVMWPPYRKDWCFLPSVKEAHFYAGLLLVSNSLRNSWANGVTGFLMRGQSGWGMNMAPLDTIINTYGGRWFDLNWKPQLSTSAVQQAVAFYATLF